MAAYASMLLNYLLPHHCYDELIVNYNLFHVSCLKIALSKVLGLAIILGSILVKLPQIVKLMSAKSAEGISFYGIILELVAITATVAYSLANGFPFSSWGEGLFLLVQTAVIGALVLHYGGSPGKMATFLFTYAISLYVLLSGLTPMAALGALQALQVPIIISSKMIQALENYRNGSTGQLSAVTVFLLFGGSIARIFTSIQETGDQLVILTYVCATFANGVIAVQILYYWNNNKLDKLD